MLASNNNMQSDFPYYRDLDIIKRFYQIQNLQPEEGDTKLHAQPTKVSGEPITTCLLVLLECIISTLISLIYLSICK